MSTSANRQQLLSRLRTGVEQLALDAGDSACDRLIDYIELLARWNATYNLTAVRTPSDMIGHHLLDSLSIAGFVRGSNLADLGSGAGLPGIPLAVMAPKREHVLIDSNGKKARFLREAVRVLGLSNVRIEQCRVEQAQGRFDTVTARAFASVSDMLAAGGHLLAPGGVWLAMKGQLPDRELTGLPPGFELRAIRKLAVPGVQAQRHLIEIGRTDGRAGHA